jgi:hypothetical protein
MPDSVQPSRQQLEDEWRQRALDAKLRLQLARDYVREVQRDLQRGSVPAADGNFAQQHALRAENLALRHYRDVLRTLADLVVRGKIPPAGKSA